MIITRTRTVDGVVERLFEITVAGERVPGVLWTPEGATGPRPLVLMGHGTSQHKKLGPIAARGQGYAREFGWAAAAIDAPGHGDRVSREVSMALATDIWARIQGEKPAYDPERLADIEKRAEQGLHEWMAALDALQGLPDVGSGPVGYWGVSMGTMIGMGFVAADSRVRAAVLGLTGLRPRALAFEAAARSLAIPVRFVMQWDDELVTRRQALGLFDIIGSEDKTLHANRGGHMGVPAHESESWARFFQRHLA